MTTAFSHLPRLHPYTLLSLLLLVFSGCLVLVAPSDVDYWWHLRSGVWIAASGVPTSDPFSHTAQGRLWVDHEWLQQWLIQAMNQALGYAGPMLIYGLVQAAGTALLWRSLREHGAGRRLSLILLLAYFVLSAPTWGVRPQGVTAPLLALSLLILERQRRAPTTGSARLAWLVPLIGLWANLHGSFLLGLAVIGAYGVGAGIEGFLQQRPAPPLRPLAWVLAASALATLFNPYGLELWLLPFDYLRLEGGNALRHIDEWQSPDFHQPMALILPAVLLPLLLFGLARDHDDDSPWYRRIDVTPAILVIAFTLMALNAKYHFPLFGIAVLPIVAAALARAVPAWSRQQDEPVAVAEGRVLAALALPLCLLIPVLMSQLPQAQSTAAPRTDGRLPYPELAARYLATLPVGTRLYNDFGWGGFLIQRLYPQQTVFIDGRVDLYRDRIFDDHLRVDSLQPGWQQLLKRYQVGAVIIRNGSALDAALAADSDWTVGHRDPLAVVYRTADEPGGPAETVQAFPQLSLANGRR